MSSRRQFMKTVSASGAGIVAASTMAVSYTHLTLPTIYSV